MIKYTILYKNGKTWNGKAEKIGDIPVVDCHLLFIQQDNDGYTRIFTKAVTVGRGATWYHTFTFGHKEPKPTRKPNPASVTKKQKAFDKTYAEWRTNKYSKPFPLGHGGADCSIKAYKKYLWEQKQAELKNVLKETSLDEFVKISFPSGVSISWDTKGETVQSLVKKITGETGTNTSDGWIPWHGGKCPVPNESRVEVQWKGGGTSLILRPERYYWEHDLSRSDILAYRLLDEDGNPIKYSEPKKLNIKVTVQLPGQIDSVALPIQLTYDEPTKTTYTFWLGAFGEISDER